MGYPNHHWLSENNLQLYREQYFNDGKPDTLTVVNKTGKTIKYAIIDSVDKFLLFDLPSDSETKMLNSRPRGDSKWLGIGGEFSDGQGIVRSTENLSIPKAPSGPGDYHVQINADGTTLFELRDPK